MLGLGLETSNSWKPGLIESDQGCGKYQIVILGIVFCHALILLFWAHYLDVITKDG
jgi:hypothetical protein